MLFLTIEFANKAENKYFVGTRYYKARALGLSFMGYDVVLYEGEYSTLCPSRLQNRPCTFG